LSHTQLGNSLSCAYQNYTTKRKRG